MAEKPETKFRRKLRVELEKFPNSWWESIQQSGIRGTPDLLGCIGPFFVAIEVKTDVGIESKLQEYKLFCINKCGSVALTVSPSNMADSLKTLEKLSKKGLNLKNGKRNTIQRSTSD